MRAELPQCAYHASIATRTVGGTQLFDQEIVHEPGSTDRTPLVLLHLAGSLQRRSGVMEMVVKRIGMLSVSLVWSAVGLAAPGCPDIEHFLADKAVGVVCVHSDDLRTNNPNTTPAN